MMHTLKVNCVILCGLDVGCGAMLIRLNLYDIYAWELLRDTAKFTRINC